MEAALVTPILFLTLIGIIEMSLLMRDLVAASGSARIGARVAAVSASAGPGTCVSGSDAATCVPARVPKFAQAAVEAIQRGSSSMPKSAVENIYVYDANALGYPMPEGNSDITSCNTDCVKFVWVPAANSFRYVSGSWDSKSVNACVNESDAVGVGMKIRHDFVTKVFGSSWRFDERTVMKFEPLPSSSCKPGTPQAHP